jgi:hypothetical protein
MSIAQLFVWLRTRLLIANFDGGGYGLLVDTFKTFGDCGQGVNFVSTTHA